ncbi:MAG: hypothetical protein ACM3YF_00410 [Candidatus Zixiibacteriota bacterium]
MKKISKTSAFLILGFIIGIITPYLFLELLRTMRPHVSENWLKARCYEFDHQGPDRVVWKKVGENKWYFKREHFGARLFHLQDSLYFLVFSPDGDGHHAYVYTSEKKLFDSPDDAMSMGYEWARIESIDPQDKWFLKSAIGYFFTNKSWREIF